MKQSSSDPQRLTALNQTQLLDTAAEEAFDRLTRIASYMLRSEIAAVSLVDHDRIYLKSIKGLNDPMVAFRSVPGEHSLCRMVVETGEPVVISDVRNLPLAKKNNMISQYGLVSYLGVPMRMNSGFIIGSFCAIERYPREWLPEEVSMMKDLAGSVMTEIELRMLNAWKSEILSIVSHDLKNPLSAITLTSQRLLREVRKVEPNIEQRIGPAIERIQRTGDYMQLLINNTLDRERLESEPVELNRKWVSLRKIVETAIELIRPLAEEKNVQVKVVTNCDECETYVDETRFLQVLVNLLGNAIKFSPEGTEVVFRANLEARESQFSISDQGPGIPKGDIENVFKRFWRGLSSKEGHGLGLHIISKIVRAHGGKISILSREGGGSEFKVTLPGELQPQEISV